jgi:hypothetical protein
VQSKFFTVASGVLVEASADFTAGRFCLIGAARARCYDRFNMITDDPDKALRRALEDIGEEHVRATHGVQNSGFGADAERVVTAWLAEKELERNAEPSNSAVDAAARSAASAKLSEKSAETAARIAYISVIISLLSLIASVAFWRDARDAKTPAVPQKPAGKIMLKPGQ